MELAKPKGYNGVRKQQKLEMKCWDVPELKARRAQRGYTVVLDAEGLAARYQALIHAVITTPLLKGFCYTQFADTFQEANGLLTADRRPKVPLAELCRMTSQNRMHIPGAV